MSNFKMSPKYGANNSYHVCPWCGKKTGGYTSFGELPDDAKAPETLITGYDPCIDCNKTWQKTVPVIEISAKQIVPGQPAINSDKENPVYPTLRVACITRDAARGLKMDTAEIGVPYLLGENRFSELFDDVIESRLRDKLRKETDEIIAQRMAEDAAKVTT